MTIIRCWYKKDSPDTLIRQAFFQTLKIWTSKVFQGGGVGGGGGGGGVDFKSVGCQSLAAMIQGLNVVSGVSKHPQSLWWIDLELVFSGMIHCSYYFFALDIHSPSQKIYQM